MHNWLSDQSVTDSHVTKVNGDLRTDCKYGIQHVAANMTCGRKSSGEHVDLCIIHDIILCFVKFNVYL